MRIITMALVALILCGCVAPVTPVTPMSDVAPEPQPQPYTCAQTGDSTEFVLTCTEPTPTPVATPTPAFYYFWCDGDVRCASGQYRVYWDRDLTMLRCALPQGDKVTVIATGYSKREGEGEPLAWVVTGAMAGTVACEGWTPMSFLRGAE